MKNFAPFDAYDTKETRFELVPCTNRNIKAVYTLFTQYSQLSLSQRSIYAQKAGLSPIDIKQADGSTEKGYEFENVYTSELLFYSALAEKLFIAFPKLVQLNEKNEPEFIAKENPSADDLRLDIVKEAFFFMKQQYNLTQTLL
jgi:hypothetical protein